MRELRDSKRQLETVLAFLLPISGILKNLLLFKAFFFPLHNETSGHITYTYINTYKNKNNSQLLPSLKWISSYFLGEKRSHVMRYH